MKRFLICTAFLVTMLLCFTSCQKGAQEQTEQRQNATSKQTGLWQNATYTEDTELGKGDTTVEVKFIVEKNSITFTIHTDKETLGDALLEHKLISGEEGPYGMYVKKVNGIEADYDKTKTYWGFNKNGESMMTGVDAEKIANGNKYEIVYTTEDSKK